MNPDDTLAGDTLEGGCLCGAVRYRVQGQPLAVNYCHCRQCRRHAGAPVAAFASYKAKNVAWTGDMPRVFASSDIAGRGFCPQCGTPLTWMGRATPDEIDIGVGTFDDASSFTPGYHLWTESALPWLHIDDPLPRYRRSRRES